MRAVSVRQPYAEQIASGEKRIEHRSWVTRTGPILIVASKTAEEGGEDLPRGVAVCVVHVDKVTGPEGDYKWHLSKPRRVPAIPVQGYAAIYHVNDPRIDSANDGPGPLVVERKAPRVVRYQFLDMNDDAIGEPGEVDLAVACARGQALADERNEPIAIWRKGEQVDSWYPSTWGPKEQREWNIAFHGEPDEDD